MAFGETEVDCMSNTMIQVSSWQKEAYTKNCNKIRRLRGLPARVARCDELDERSAGPIVILALFGFFTLQVVPLTYGTYAYIEEIDNER